MRARLLVSFVIILAGSMIAGCGGGTKRVQPTTVPPEQRPAVTEPTTPVTPEGADLTARMALGVVYFDFDRSDIRADQRGVLADNAKMLESHSEVARVVIQGNCDERGTNEYNMALGQRRADSVKSYMTNYGIASTKLSTVSFGEDQPMDPGHTESAWAANRRAEFMIQQ